MEPKSITTETKKFSKAVQPKMGADRSSCELEESSNTITQAEQKKKEWKKINEQRLRDL